MPWIDGPRDDAAILNAHFVIDAPSRLDGLPPITGLINSRTHWVFLKGDVVSLTISAADRLGVMDEAPDELAPRPLGGDMPGPRPERALGTPPGGSTRNAVQQ